MTTLVASIVVFIAFNYNHSLTQIWTDIAPYTNAFFPVAILWSCCLAYFFGFFGIPFLDKDKLDGLSSSKADTAKNMSGYKTEITVSNSLDTNVLLHPSRFHTPCIELHFGPSAAEVDKIDFTALSDGEVVDYLRTGVVKENMLGNTLKWPL